MFSTITIALSTTIPIPTIMPIIVSMLSDQPIVYNVSIVIITQRGIASVISAVIRNVRRKYSRTSAAKTPPHTAVFRTLLTESLTNVP